jgi:hypothetical protein
MAQKAAFKRKGQSIGIEPCSVKAGALLGNYVLTVRKRIDTCARHVVASGLGYMKENFTYPHPPTWVALNFHPQQGDFCTF